MALEDDDDTESKIEEETETILLGSSGPKPAYTSGCKKGMFVIEKNYCISCFIFPRGVKYVLLVFSFEQKK